MYLLGDGAPSRKKNTHISKCAFRVDTEDKTSQDSEVQILRDTMHSALRGAHWRLSRLPWYPPRSPRLS